MVIHTHSKQMSFCRAQSFNTNFMYMKKHPSFCHGCLFCLNSLFFVQRTNTVGMRGESFCDGWAVTSTPSMPGLPLVFSIWHTSGKMKRQNCIFPFSCTLLPLVPVIQSGDCMQWGSKKKKKTISIKNYKPCPNPLKRLKTAPSSLQLSTEAVAVCFVEDFCL